MFEWYYITSAIQQLEKHPKVVKVIAAYVLCSEIQGNIAKTRMLKIKKESELRIAETQLECEKIRLETARIEAQNHTA
jgi:predicted RND superfamily exporter protein